MTPTLAFCAAAPCCQASLPAFPAVAFHGTSVWPGAVGFGLLVAGVLIIGYLVLGDVARVLAVVRAP